MKLLKRQLRGITKEDIESEYSKLTQQWISKTILDTAQNELLSLLWNDNIMHKELLNLSPLV